MTTTPEVVDESTKELRLPVIEQAVMNVQGYINHQEVIEDNQRVSHDKSNTS